MDSNLFCKFITTLIFLQNWEDWVVLPVLVNPVVLMFLAWTSSGGKKEGGNLQIPKSCLYRFLFWNFIWRLLYKSLILFQTGLEK